MPAAVVLAVLLASAGCSRAQLTDHRTAPTPALLQIGAARPAESGRDFSIRSADVPAARLPAGASVPEDWVAQRASADLVVWRDTAVQNRLRSVDFRVHDLRRDTWSAVHVDLRRVVDDLPDPRFDADRPIMVAGGRLVFELTDATAVQAVVLSVPLKGRGLRRLVPVATSADLDAGRIAWARGTGEITLEDLVHHTAHRLPLQLPAGCSVKESPGLDLAGPRLLVGLACDGEDRGVVVDLTGRVLTAFAETSGARLTDAVLIIRPGRTTYTWSFGQRRLVQLDIRDYSDPGWDPAGLTFHAGAAVEELIPR